MGYIEYKSFDCTNSGFYEDCDDCCDKKLNLVYTRIYNLVTITAYCNDIKIEKGDYAKIYFDDNIKNDINFKSCIDFVISVSDRSGRRTELSAYVNNECITIERDILSCYELYYVSNFSISFNLLT